VGTPKNTPNRFVRAVIVSGMLGAAGLMAVASPAAAQSDPSDPSDPSGSTTTTIFEDTTTTTTGSDFSSPADTGSMAETGGESAMLLLAGLGAGTGAVVLRRATRST